MNWQSEKERNNLFSLGLLSLAVLLTGFTAATVINIARGAGQDALLTKETLDQIKPDPEKTKQYIKNYQTAAQELTRNNMFVPPRENKSEQPGECTAIFGDEARIGNRWVKAGDRLGDAEVLDIGPTAVTLRWQNQTIRRSPVLVVDNSSNNRRSGRDRGSPQNRRASRDSSSPRNMFLQGRGSSGDRPAVYTYESSSGGGRNQIAQTFSLQLGDLSEGWSTINMGGRNIEFQTIDTGNRVISIGTVGADRVIR